MALPSHTEAPVSRSVSRACERDCRLSHVYLSLFNRPKRIRAIFVRVPFIVFSVGWRDRDPASAPWKIVSSRLSLIRIPPSGATGPGAFAAAPYTSAICM
jgi:hypothetical protein